jgi:hypothetical protein
MAAKTTRKPARRKTVKKKASARRVVETIHPEEEYYDSMDETETEDEPERPAAHGTLENNPEADDEERSEENFHKLKGKYKKHERIEESALKDINYHSPGGKNSRITGSTSRRKKSQF